MIDKRPLRPDRIRRIPASFSWVDHRLVRDRFIERCDHRALSLYLFLATVADAQGLSYYSDNSLGRYLRMNLDELAAARQELARAELVAYSRPLYQVLELPGSSTPTVRAGEPSSVTDILRRIMEGAKP